MNAIYVRGGSKLLLPERTGVTPVHVLATLQNNQEKLGDLLAEEVAFGASR